MAGGSSGLCLLDPAETHIGGVAVHRADAAGLRAGLQRVGAGIDAQLEEIAQGLLGYAPDQTFEHVVGPLLVFDQGVFAADTDKADAVFKLVDLVQVLLPTGVDGVQGDGFFDLAEDLLADGGQAALVGLLDRLAQLLAQRDGADLGALGLGDGKAEEEVAAEFVLQAFPVPFLWDVVWIDIGGQHGVEGFFDHLLDLILCALAFEHVAAAVVDDLALLVHDIVVFEHVFAHLEIASLDLFLCALDRFGDHAGFDDLTLLGAELVHDSANAL